MLNLRQVIANDKLDCLQYGKIEVSSDLLDIEPALITRMFAEIQFLPLRIDWELDKAIYQGLSPRFRMLKIGEIIPLYRVKVIDVLPFSVETTEIK